MLKLGFCALTISSSNLSWWSRKSRKRPSGLPGFLSVGTPNVWSSSIWWKLPSAWGKLDDMKILGPRAPNLWETNLVILRYTVPICSHPSVCLCFSSICNMWRCLVSLRKLLATSRRHTRSTYKIWIGHIWAFLPCSRSFLHPFVAAKMFQQPAAGARSWHDLMITSAMRHLTMIRLGCMGFWSKILENLGLTAAAPYWNPSLVALGRSHQNVHRTAVQGSNSFMSFVPKQARSWSIPETWELMGTLGNAFQGTMAGSQVGRRWIQLWPCSCRFKDEYLTHQT